MSATDVYSQRPSSQDGGSPERVGVLASNPFVEVRIGGTAARGVIAMGLFLATAATLDHRHVIQTQTHALEETDVHGHSDVIISDAAIDFPELQGADLTVALCQWAADSYASILKPEGVLLYDSGQVTGPVSFSGTTYALPLDRLAHEAAGRGERAPHMVALGAAVAITGVVSAESLMTTGRDLELPGSREARRKALAFGLALDFEQWKGSGGC